ncbi:dihydrolipoyl dehydrogenase family protein [Candidatus Vidania fulgoroideorum]
MNYDFIILGCGPAGISAALNLKRENNKVLCIEKNKIGGECLNYGCIPSKTFIEMSKRSNIFNRNKVDLVINSIYKDIKLKFNSMNIDFIENCKCEIKKKYVIVNKKLIFYKKLIISTGTKARTIKLNGKNILNKRNILNNKTIFKIKKIPDKVVFIGCGVISLELGFMFNNFGSKVIILESKNKIMQNIDIDILKKLKLEIRKRNIVIYKNTKDLKVEACNKNVKINFISDEKKINIKSEILMLSIGKKSVFNKENKIGIKLDENNFIKVNSDYMTNIKNIYAIGDIIGEPFLAYKAENDGLRLSEIIHNKEKFGKNFLLPSVIFTTPEISWIGKREQELKKGSYTKAIINIPNICYSKCKGIKFGILKLIFSKKNKKLIGAHLFFENSKEIIFSLYLIMKFKMDIKEIKRLLYIHPSMHEAIKYSIIKSNEKI